MTTDERSFLTEEYKLNWGHLGLLDTRRFQIFQYYIAFIAISIGGVFGIEKISYNDQRSFNFVLMIVAILIIVISIVCRLMLKSQRNAIERHRNRINEIRRIFLIDTKDTDIEKLFKHGKNKAFLETKPTIHKELKFFDIFRKGKRCTALYIKLFIDVCMFMAFILLIYCIIIQFIS